MHSLGWGTDRLLRTRWELFLLGLLVAFAGLVYCPAARGETVGESARRAVVEYQGEPGFWFRRDVALQMLADLQELPIRRQELTLIQEELELRDRQVERLREIVSLERGASQTAQDALGAALERASTAEGSRDAWWRSPWLWLTVGIVTTVVLEIAAVAVFAYVFD